MAEHRRDGFWTAGGWMRLEDAPPEINSMTSPVRCAHCQTVYDLGKVEVVQRYTDCSMWHCPGCRLLVDDRGETGWKSRKDYYRLDEYGRTLR